ncbi:TetR family transcriptional regulator [Amycolatopsis antarctica]|uniref:TetR family transcriptional regulator n=1 Tax=Amycolatopsis antarctica TaxID=1854586 RepID=A0A263D257_9PSEU|nr:TetR/AcrR family transcriptional regulator [Amycolatopsis antarctica]OZM72554.1 TetR family transcriptional regulator [Amycolatopsis antarctica]
MTDGQTTRSAGSAPLRRQPVQQRSADRVERMLDASAALIEEIGYDGVTTTLIAKRAGVAVGSLYQFFPDKRAVVQALTQRNLERFMSAVGEQMNAGEHQHWWDLVDGMLDIYLRMHREVQGFSQVHFGDVVDTRLLDDQRDNNGVVAEAVVQLLAERFGLDEERLELPVAVAISTADGLLKLAFRDNPAGDQAVVDETKYLLKGYLASRLGD